MSKKISPSGGVGAPAIGKLPFEQGLEMVAVEDLGQGVEQGLLPDFALQPADGGDVAADNKAVVGAEGKAGKDEFELQVLVVEHDLHFHRSTALLQKFHVPGFFLFVHGPGEPKKVAAGQERPWRPEAKVMTPFCPWS
jgi:hypothetical protein